MGTGFLMGINIFHGYGFGTAKPSGFVPVDISRLDEPMGGVGCGLEIFGGTKTFPLCSYELEKFWGCEKMEKV
jgi:hypothetical protein